MDGCHPNGWLIGEILESLGCIKSMRHEEPRQLGERRDLYLQSAVDLAPTGGLLTQYRPFLLAFPR